MAQDFCCSLFVLSLAGMIAEAIATKAVAQDVAAEEKSFNKFLACHQVGETAKNTVGPFRNGLFGRRSGVAAGYNSSFANKSSGLIWDDAIFTDYIKNPKGKIPGTNKIPGTKMSFAGIENAQEIKDLAGFLKQFGADGKKGGRSSLPARQLPSSMSTGSC